MKKAIKIIVACFFGIIALIVVVSMAYTVAEDQYGIIRQFGKVVDIRTEPGLYFKIPMVEEISFLPKNKRVYDVPSSEVLTSDKKALVVDNYVVWSIDDPLTFVQRVGTIEEMEKRLDAAIYSVVKNTMGTKEQSNIIQAGSNGQGNRNEVNKIITDSVNSQINKEYGVSVVSVEIKRLDLPADNEAAVYNRMISDRQQIAASYKAEGDLEASKIRNETDKKSSIILSTANAEAERIKGEGEAEYMRIIASAYDTIQEQEFYEFTRSLEAARNSMLTKGNKKVLILPADSTIAKIFIGE
ncbi:MAG: rane protease subunit, stomatin/prohibitin [Clostridia bacterium]|jgi:membrane protease subunit HflC|nr:rane protease subunit, stomatin/prohibitin [Clostridia bacterium]